MIVQLTASKIAELVGGRLVGEDVVVDGVQFDSRAEIDGRLFIAIEAERNGHDFVPHAFSAGAHCAMVSQHIDEPAGTLVVVDNTLNAFASLARNVRMNTLAHAQVVGVTGSVGKTSTKNLITGALSSLEVSSSLKSFNNEQGVPFTILNASQNSDVVVVEMGMRGFGEISHLCDIAAPTIGVVTRVGEAHTARLGGIDGVATAKAELVQALPATGTAVLNADDERVLRMASLCAGSVVTYGSEGDVSASRIRTDPLGCSSFFFSSPWGSGDVSLRLPGQHMMQNALAAIAVGGILSVPLEQLIAGLESVVAEDRRMVVHQLPSGSLVIDDCYNANPTSVTAALRTVANLDVDRKIAVLGEMAEVDDPEFAHRQIVAIADELGIEIVAIDTDYYGLASTHEVPKFVGSSLEGGNTAVLVKGSRIAGLERIVDELIAS